MRIASTLNHRQTRSIIAVTLIVFTSACGGGDSTTQPPPTNQDPPAVASVSLDRTTLSIEQAKTSTLVATLRDATGATLTGRSITWSSDANGVATVAQSGVVTAVAVGTANIRATSEGKSASAAVTVTPIPVASVVLSSNSAELDIGGTATFTAETRAANGQVLTGRNIVWAVADNTVVSIANGVVTAIAPGSTTISATSEGQVASANIVVRAPSCASTAPTGRLVRTSATEFTFTTLAGWIVSINRDRMRITSPTPGQSHNYEYWGSTHENVGGKHIKDLLGDRRTILLPGGVIITAYIVQPAGPPVFGLEWVQFISIYEGNQSHRISMQSFNVVQSCALPMFGEAEEADGEAASIFFNETGMRMENVYQQDASPTGAPLAKVFNTVPLAQTSFANPNQVTDFFDDPRLGHTFW